MDWTLIAKLVIAGVGIFTAGKVLHDIFIGNRTNLREEYRFAKEFLDETDKTKLHPYTLGKGYQAVAGTTAIKASEAEYILSLENPIQCLRDFVLSKQLFERLDTEGDFKLVFKKKYMSDWSRWWRKKLYLFLYFVLAFAAISPMLLSNIFKVELSKSILQMLFTLPFFGLYAWLSLKAYGKLSRAEHIHSNQRHHTSRVIISGIQTKSDAA